jgi:peptidoglycan hydrolase-like protein with peptidoglycan-binding domain
MKNIGTKIITLGVLATVITTSTPVFAATKSSEIKTTATVSSTTIQKPNTITLATYWSQHVWDVVDAGGVVKYGDKGQAVSEVQGYLRLAGYNITNDGIFGTSTKNAVKSYQSSHGLSADGIVGKSTWKVLEKEL